MADGKGEYALVEKKESAEEKEEKEEAVGLKPTLGLVQGCTIIVGSIIGSGIFIAPGGVLLQTESVNMSLMIWIASGLYSMVGAYCYAELGLLIRKPGGDYTYILDSLGPFIGFIRLWAECLIVRPCTITIVALTFAKYSVKLIFPECEPPDDSVRILAAVCICILAFVNCWEVKWATAVQDIFTYAKLLALFIIMVTGIVQLGRGQTQYFTWDDTEDDITKIALSFYSGLFAYNGWNYLNFVIPEMKDPVKDLPKAIAISIVLVTEVYALTNIAFYTTLSVPEVLCSEAVAATFAEIMYGPMAFMIPIFVAMSTFGSVNGILLTSSRLFYAGACEGQMPEILSMIQVNKNTPAPAVLCVALGLYEWSRDKQAAVKKKQDDIDAGIRQRSPTPETNISRESSPEPEQRVPDRKEIKRHDERKKYKSTSRSRSRSRTRSRSASRGSTPPRRDRRSRE